MTLKLLEENTGKILEDIGIANDFLHRTPKAKEIIGRTGKWDLHQIKKLLHNKGNNYQKEETVYRMGKEAFSALHPTGD
jgi:hypothetical protein